MSACSWMSDLGEKLHCVGLGALSALAANLDRGQHAVLQYAQMREQVEVLENHSDLATKRDEGCAILGERSAVDHDDAALQTLEAVDASDQGGLSGAGGPAHDDALAAIHRQADIIQSLEAAEELGSVPYGEQGCWLGELHGVPSIFLIDPIQHGPGPRAI